MQVLVASGVILAAEHTRQESSLTASSRVSRVVHGKGHTAGCSIGDELLGVGGGGRGFVAHVTEVSSTGHILKLSMLNSGSGYSTAPRIVSKNKSCRCLQAPSPEATSPKDTGATISASMDVCWNAEISTVVPVSEGWQIQAVVVDGERGVMHHYVGGLQPCHRMSTVALGQAANAGLDLATLGARRTTNKVGGKKHVSQLWKGEIAELLAYQCAAASSASGEWFGCTTPADLDRLGRYMANKYHVAWEAAAGLTEGIGRRSAGPDHALSVVQGEAGAGSVPLIRSLHPHIATGTWPQTITISGRYFGGPGDEEAVQVQVGHQPCTQLRLFLAAGTKSGTNATSPQAGEESVGVCMLARAPGSIAHVTVTAWGVSGMLPSAFHHGAPKILSLIPTKVHSAGGSVLTIMGERLDSLLPFSVILQSHKTTKCTNLERVSARELRCHLPQLLRTASSVILSVDDQADEALVSSATLEVTNVPAFYTECPASADGSKCMTCCMRSCQRWELSPEGNNRALGGAYYDHCNDECSLRVCPAPASSNVTVMRQ